ncbi:single-stranded DNA-binding protein [Mycoplasma tauri]|uniref:single-stranded DNA-binding protein n=1 Tax=Mycoplasma tauri TaxID=547987 RepID=UPI001966D3F6|nr:single-stranded DNA-binding protein [Mycoplasma tauri]QSB07631.1 single-stranded DNA-binding protein [Mycoplasma tauri]
MNKVILSGRLASEKYFEIEYKKKDNSIGKLLKFLIAVNEYGQKQAEFIEITIFDEQVSLVKNHLKKGNKVEVIGKLSVNKYKNKNDEIISKMNVIASNLVLGSSKEIEEKSKDGKLEDRETMSFNFNNQNDLKNDIDKNENNSILSFDFSELDDLDD